MQQGAKQTRKGRTEDDDLAQRYAPKKLKKNIDFELENQAIQQILDNVLRLQTYIAMREEVATAGHLFRH